MLIESFGLSSHKRRRALGAALAAFPLTLAAGLLLSTAVLADSKLPPILILPGQDPQTVTEAPQASEASQPATPPATTQPAAEQAGGDQPAVVISPAPAAAQGDEPAVVISPPAGGQGTQAPEAPQQATAPAEATPPQNDEPTVVISPAPGSAPQPAEPLPQATAPVVQEEQPVVVISPAPDSATAPAPTLQPKETRTQEAQTQDEEPVSEQEALPDEVAVPSESEPSTVSPSADKAADQGEDMAPVGDTTQVVYGTEGVEVPIDSLETLEYLANQMSQNPAARAQIYGYATSPDGSENAARRLSLERAQAVRGYLVDHGVAVSRFTIRPQGVATDGGPSDRVDIVLIHP